VCGSDIDEKVYGQVLARMDSGLPIDEFIVHELLVAELSKANKIDLLAKYNFGHGWYQRFATRHKLSYRSATTKMREMPVDFAAKKQTYIDILAMVINDNNVPDELIINCDETNIQYVPRSSHTLSRVGTKKVRLIGVNAEKPQCTVTLGASASGNLLHPQIIFGGKTKKTLLNTAPVPSGWLYSYTTSHWQTEESYINYVEHIIVPYKNKVIKELNLPNSQKTILIHDLHFSHLTARLLSYLTHVGIVPVMIPAACTDVLQVCDICINKSFKMATKRAFRDHCHTMFNAHIASNGLAQDFKMTLGIGTMKPLLTGFVQRGLESLQTSTMRESIRNCFRADAPGGCLDIARDPEYLVLARERRQTATEELFVADESAEMADSDCDEDPTCNKEVIEERLVLTLRIPKGTTTNART